MIRTNEIELLVYLPGETEPVPWRLVTCSGFLPRVGEEVSFSFIRANVIHGVVSKVRHDFHSMSNGDFDYRHRVYLYLESDIAESQPTDKPPTL
jgi:hypothetical protein